MLLTLICIPRERWGTTIALGLIVAGMIALAFVPLRSDEIKVDAMTGSITRQTFWFHRFSFGKHFTASPLELRLKKMGVAWTADWRFVAAPERTIYGSTVVNVCGRTPPIGSWSSGLQDIVDSSSDAQILDLVNTLRNGTEEQQDAAFRSYFDPRAASPTTHP